MLREADVFETQGFSFADPGEQRAAPTVVAVEDGPDGATATIPDAHLLFNSDFLRSFNDLHLNGHDGERAIVRDYFTSGERVALLSRDGARLSPDVIDALTSAVAPGQYAQATQTAPAASDAVGRVVTASADSTILRNGVPVTVRPGDAVLRADVLQTTGGTMAVTFNDGSTLNLTANTRIVVSEFVYSPNGAGNSQLLDLVQGSLTFISGEVAHSGNMSIGTPVATMGIRGTVGGVTTSSDGTVQFYVSQSATGAVIINAQGQIIANVVQDGPLILVRPVGPLQVVAEEIGKSPQQLAIELQALQQIVSIKAIGDQLLQQFFQQQPQQNPNPQSGSGPHTQILTDDRFKITLISNDDVSGGGDALPTHAVITTYNDEPDAPPVIVTVPIPVNLPPIVFAPWTVTGQEDQTLTFNGARAISVFDNDSPILTVTLSITAGLISFASTAGLAFSAGDGANDTTMTFSGSADAINAAMNGLTFTPPQDYSGNAVLSITNSDGTSAPTTTTVDVTVESVNDAPVLNYFNLNIDGDGPVTLTTADFSVTDPDGPQVIFTVTNVTGGEFVVDSGQNNMFSMQFFQQGPLTFTSDDIAAGRVKFVPDGSGDPVSYSISVSDGINSSTPTVDHQPQAVDIEAEATAGSTGNSYNFVIFLDISGSMGAEVSPGVTRLELAKQAIFNLLTNQNIDINQVMVCTIADAGHVHFIPNVGPWMDADTAYDLVDSFGLAGGTNYEGAVGDVISYWNSYEPTPADKTLVYFISDGAPSPGHSIDDVPGLQDDWEDLLLAKGVDASYAIGISTGVNDEDLAPIAWAPGDPGFEPKVLTSADGLDDTIQSTVIQTHNIFEGGASLGGDGGRVFSITVDGETYTWNGLNTVSSNSQQTWSATAASLTVATALGGTLIFYFGDEGQAQAGDWTYTPPPAGTHSAHEVFRYTLVDNDGDKSSANIDVQVNGSNIVPVAANDTIVIDEDTASSGLGAVLTANDTDGDEDTLTITAVGNATNGTVDLNGGNPIFTPHANFSGQGSFTYTVSDGFGGTSTATVSVDVKPVAETPVVTSGYLAPASDPTPVTSGDEFRVNSFVSGAQGSGAVASLAGGGFVITWSSNEQDGSGSGVYAQRYNSAGVAVGDEMRVNTTTHGDQLQPAISESEDGGFLIAWSTGNGIYSQRFDQDGNAIGGEISVSTSQVGNKYAPVVAGLSDGGFVVAWVSFGSTFNEVGIYAQLYDEAGVAVGGEFQVNSHANALQHLPSVAALASGGFVIAWTAYQDGSFYGVYRQQYDENGGAIGGEVRVNTHTEGDQYVPSVASLTDGGYVVAWMSWNQDGDSGGIFAQRYDENGIAAGPEFQVNIDYAGNQSGPSVIGLPDGGFLVSWNEQRGLNGMDLFGQRFGADGFATGDEFLINNPLEDGRSSYIAAGGSGLAVLPDGRLVQMWENNDLAGNSDVYARIFDIPQAAHLEDQPISLSFNVDFDNDSSESHIVTLTGLPAGFVVSDGEVSATSSGEGVGIDLQYFYLGALTITPAANWNGTFTVTLTASNVDSATLSTGPDSDTASASHSVTITIDAVEDAPAIASNGGGQSATVAVSEGQRAVTTVHATDGDNDTLTYSIVSGGASPDAAMFEIDPTTGVLRFASVPDFEQPTDTDQDNSYVVQVRASDGQQDDLQTITVNVTDDALENGTYQVTSGADSGNGTLRDAILYANAHAGTTITFGSGQSWNGAWQMNVADLPAITGQGTIIDGSAGAGTITIDAVSGSRVFVFGNGEDPIDVTVRNIHVRNGRDEPSGGETGMGGAFYVSDNVNLTIQDSFINDSQARGYEGASAYGGAIYVGENSNLELIGRVEITSNQVIAVDPGVALGSSIYLAGPNGVLTFAPDAGTMITIGDDIANAGSQSIVIDGLGTVVLNDDNSFSGTTRIVSGTLQIGHEASLSNSAVEVGALGILRGGGSNPAEAAGVGDLSVLAGGAFGAGPGGLYSATSLAVLRTGSLTLAAGATLVAEISGGEPGAYSAPGMVWGYDQIQAHGAVSLGGATLHLFTTRTDSIGQTYTLIDNDGTDSVVGTFAGLGEGSDFLGGSHAYTISYAGGDGNDVVVTRVNAAPLSSADSITAIEDEPYVFALSDFGSYSDVDGNAIAAIQIVGVPANGALEFFDDDAWNSVTAGQNLNATTISAGNLRFIPDVDESGAAYASVAFKVGDGLRFSADTYDLTIEVTPVNDVPQAQADLIVASAQVFEVPDWVLLRNDNDPDGFLSVTDADGDAQVGTIADHNENGYVTVDLDGAGYGAFQYVASDGQSEADGLVNISHTANLNMSHFTDNLIIIADDSGAAMAGGSGSDILIGGAGGDTMTGNGDGDVFVFKQGGGEDTINDFAGQAYEGSDVIALDGFAFSNYEEFQQYATITDFEANGEYGTVIDLGEGNTITLMEVQSADLTAADFIFHQQSTNLV